MVRELPGQYTCESCTIPSQRRHLYAARATYTVTNPASEQLGKITATTTGCCFSRYSLPTHTGVYTAQVASTAVALGSKLRMMIALHAPYIEHDPMADLPWTPGRIHQSFAQHNELWAKHTLQYEMATLKLQRMCVLGQSV